MKTTSLPKFCLIGSLVLQAIVSIAILVLYRKHRNSITGLEDGGFYLGEGGKNSVFFITAIPPHVDETSGHLAMATGILTLLIGWAVTCFVVFANSHRKRVSLPPSFARARGRNPTHEEHCLVAMLAQSSIRLPVRIHQHSALDRHHDKYARPAQGIRSYRSKLPKR